MLCLHTFDFTNSSTSLQWHPFTNLKPSHRHKCTGAACRPLCNACNTGIASVARTTFLPATLPTKWQALVSCFGNLLQTGFLMPKTLYDVFAFVHHLHVANAMQASDHSSIFFLLSLSMSASVVVIVVIITIITINIMLIYYYY